jgi:hypothetical protein
MDVFVHLLYSFNAVVTEYFEYACHNIEKCNF